MPPGVSTDSSHEGTKPEGLSQLAQELRRGLDNPDLSSASLPQLPKLEGELGLSPDAEAPVRVRLHNLADALEQLDRRDPRSMTEEQLVAHRDTLHVVLAMAQGIHEALGSQSQPRLVTNSELRQIWRDIVAFRENIMEQVNQTGDLDGATKAIAELQQRTDVYTTLVERGMRSVLGKNLLGSAAWKQGFGVQVSAPPVIPESLSAELFNSECPLHPGEKIKDTHLLVLIPRRIDREPYSALKLAELCARRQETAGSLIYDQPHWNGKRDWSNEWKESPWANSGSAENEWVLVPRSDPDPQNVPAEHHFRDKDVTSQAEVCQFYAAHYRVATALEVMTAAVLNSAVNHERLLTSCYLRTAEPDVHDGRVLVGNFKAIGLVVEVTGGNYNSGNIGVALARKL